jgi:hypothetical protein
MGLPQVIAILMTFMLPLIILIWNKKRVQGKMLCFFARKDKSLAGELCLLKKSFVIWKDRAYDVYPDYCRVARFPMGWPWIFQEIIPAALYDEEDAIQKDWITLQSPKEGSLKLRAALEENWVAKLVQETTADVGKKINWRKILPIAMIAIGIIGLIVILTMRGCSLPGAGA